MENQVYYPVFQSGFVQKRHKSQKSVPNGTFSAGFLSKNRFGMETDMNIEIRAYQKQDFPALETIVRETWHYDDFASPKTAAKLAKVFLSSCFTNYTFARVAVLDGTIAGVILAKNIQKHTCSFSDRLLQITSILSLYVSKEGRTVSKIFSNVSGIDQELLMENHKTYPAELALFAVSSSCRGKGIGKMLFQSALDYMRQENLKEFYLFTDTSCNYGFYEHQGMKRQLEKKHTFHIKGQPAEMNFFLYDYQC